MSFLILCQQQNNDVKDFGLTLRPQRPGPENDLMNTFMEQLSIKAPNFWEITAFREPMLDTGFPDLVLVLWNKKITDQWNPYRKEVKSVDLKILHYLYAVGPSSLDELRAVFPMSISRCLERLEMAEMIRRSGRKWLSRSLGRNFAVRHIVAIEAKMNEWRVAVRQALRNKWFASSSCLLVPKLSFKFPETQCSDRMYEPTLLSVEM